MKESLSSRVNKLEKLVKENDSFRDWSANNLKETLNEVDDLLTDAVATADDMDDARTSRDLENALSIIRRVVSRLGD